jgi:hypothetical protein
MDVRKIVVLLLALVSSSGAVEAQVKYPPLFLATAGPEIRPSMSFEKREFSSVQLASFGANELPSVSARMNHSVLGRELHLTTTSCAADFATCKIAGTFHMPARSMIRGDPAEVVFSAGSHGRIGLHYVIKLR